MCGAAFHPGSKGGGGGAWAQGQNGTAKAEDGRGKTKPQAAAGFKWATPEILEPLGTEHKALLKMIEGSQTREELTRHGELIPGLVDAIGSIILLRWPPASPEKSLERELAQAQTAERAAEKKHLDAKTAATKAREALAKAEAAEVTAEEDCVTAKAKVADLMQRGAALKSTGEDKEFKDAHDTMGIDDSTLAIEGAVGKVKSLVAALDTKGKSLTQQQLVLQGKGAGKGGTDRVEHPYKAPGEDAAADGSLDVQDMGPNTIAVVVDENKASHTQATLLLAKFEEMQRELNRGLAAFAELKAADKDL